MEKLLCRKQICAAYQIDRITLYRWERYDGCPFVNGRIAEPQFVFWMAQRDACKLLKIKMREFLQMPREAQDKLLAAAHELRRARAT